MPRWSLLLLLLSLSRADIPASFFPAMTALDLAWGSNFASSVGPAASVCACQDFGNNTFAPCLWTRAGPFGLEGFFCTASGAPGNGTLTSILFRSALSGSLAPEVGQLSTLDSLTLDSTTLTGAIPALPGTLRLLNLRQNSFSGALPDLPTSLQQLDLSGNGLSGALAPSAGVTQIRLSGNSFSGALTWLSSLTSLVRFEAVGNRFSGAIPAVPASLQYLLLAGNLLSGPVDGSLAGASFAFQGDCDLRNNSLTACNASGGTLPGQVYCLVSCPSATTAPPTTAPPIIPCPNPLPLAVAVCQNGTWVVLDGLTNTGQLRLQGSVTVLGDLTQSPTGILEIVGGTLTISGTAQLNGTLVLTEVTTVGRYPILTAGNISGTFANISLPAAPKCLQSRTATEGNSLVVLVQPDPACSSGKSALQPKIIAAIAVGAGVGFLLLAILFGLLVARHRHNIFCSSREEEGSIR